DGIRVRADGSDRPAQAAARGGAGDHPLYRRHAGQGPELLERDPRRHRASPRQAHPMKLTLFQWLASSGLVLVMLFEVVRLRRGGQLWSAWLLRMAVWAAALVAILVPDITQELAHALGISRGADVVFYSFVLAFLAVS